MKTWTACGKNTTTQSWDDLAIRIWASPRKIAENSGTKGALRVPIFQEKQEIYLCMSKDVKRMEFWPNPCWARKDHSLQVTCKFWGTHPFSTIPSAYILYKIWYYYHYIFPFPAACWQILPSLRVTQYVQTNIAAKHLKTCGPSRAPCWNLNWKVDAILTTNGSQSGLPFIPLRICEGSVTAHNVVQANLLVAAAFLVWYSLDPNLRRASGWDEKGRRALETARTAKATQQRTFFPATICSIPHPYYSTCTSSIMSLAHDNPMTQLPMRHLRKPPGPMTWARKVSWHNFHWLQLG